MIKPKRDISTAVKCIWLEWRTLGTFVVGVVIFYAILNAFGISCPIKFLTGISCAGCGMTRAWIRVLALDFPGAFAFHPLFFVPPLYCIFYLKKSMFPNWMFRFGNALVAFLFISVFFYRISHGDSVVVFEPHNGAIYRLITSIVD